MASNSRFTGLAVWRYKTFLEHFSGMPLAAKDLKKKSMSLTEQQHWMAFSLWLLAVQPLGSEDILPVGIELKHGNEHERHL